MKSEKGVTLTSLVIYMAIFSVILAIMALISNYFFRNIEQIKDSPRYIVEFNKFSMFFIADVKNNTEIVKKFSFQKSETTINSTIKKIINVNAELGNGDDKVTRNIDFVLKYW